MEVDCQLLHPDSTNRDRYVMGTRLQTRGRGGKNAHKLPTCKFHDLDKCIQGAALKTMSQGNKIHPSNLPNLDIYIRGGHKNN